MEGIFLSDGEYLVCFYSVICPVVPNSAEKISHDIKKAET